MDVGIVGCGFAGAAAALFLSRAGHRVTVYEAVPQPSAVGAGIVVQPTGLGVLHELGLLAPVLSRGARIDRLVCMAGDRALVDLSYDTIDAGLYGVGLHRGVLFSLLFDALKSSTAQLVTGCEVRDVQHDGGRTSVVDVDGTAHGAHDLIVVADGARSKLRHRTVSRVTEYPWGALWFVAKDPEQVYDRTLYQVVRSTTQLLGFLPSGVGPDPDDGPVVSLFWSVRTDAVDTWRSGFDSWCDHVRAEDPRSAFIIEQIEDADAMLFSRYHDVVMPRWHTDNLIFIGDAAHATSPQLGQGTNLALLDAFELCRALETAPDLSAAFHQYTRRRRAHLAYYQWATRWLTPFFQSDHRWLGWLRDVFMPLTSKLPLVNTAMVGSMAGVKRGVVRPSFPLPRYPSP